MKKHKGDIITKKEYYFLGWKLDVKPSPAEIGFYWAVIIGLFPLSILLFLGYHILKQLGLLLNGVKVKQTQYTKVKNKVTKIYEWVE